MRTEADMRKILIVSVLCLAGCVLTVNGCQPQPVPVVNPPGSVAPIDQAWAQYKADQVALFTAAKANAATLTVDQDFFNYINGSLSPASGTQGNLAKDFGPAGTAIGQAFTASGPAAACDIGIQIWSGGAIPASQPQNQPQLAPQPQSQQRPQYKPQKR